MMYNAPQFIPYPKTERAKFLNEKVLPSLYKSQWKFSKNARDFSKLFHSEGRREYDLHIQLKTLEERVASFETPLKGPLMPTDLTGINYRSTQLEGLKDKTNKIRAELKVDDDSCFNKSGKVKSTQNCAHKFNEECFGRLKSITDRIESALSTTKCMHEKHRRMYPAVNYRLKRPEREGRKRTRPKAKNANMIAIKKTAKGSMI